MSDASPTPRILGAPFVGRLEQLDTLRSALLSPAVVVLSGAMGVGKSRLAKEVLDDLTKIGLSAAWFDLRFSTPSSWLRDISSDFVQPFLTDAELKTEWVSRRLRAKQNLVVFDNAEHLTHDLQSAVAWLSGRLPETSFLVTTRERWHTSYLTRHIRLEPLSDNEVISLIEHRSPQITLDEHTKQHLARLTGGLPLAIEMALEAIENLGTQRGLDGLSDGSTDSRLPALIRMSLGRLDTQAIHTLSYAAAIDLPFSSKELAALSGQDEPALRNALWRLGTLSLLRPDDQGRLALYPLVRAATEVAAPALFAEAMSRRLTQLSELTLAQTSESAGERWTRVESLSGAIEKCVRWHISKGVKTTERKPMLTCIDALHELCCQRGFRTKDLELAELIDRSDVQHDPTTQTCKAERLFFTRRREEALDVCTEAISVVHEPVLRARLFLVIADSHLQLYGDYGAAKQTLRDVGQTIASITDSTLREVVLLREKCVLLYLRGQEDRYSEIQQIAHSVRKEAARIGDWTSHGRAFLCEVLVALSQARYDTITNLWQEAIAERHGFLLPLRIGGAPALYSLILTGHEQEARELCQHYEEVALDTDRQQLAIANLALSIVFADDELLHKSLEASSNPDDSAPLMRRMDAAMRTVGFVALGDTARALAELSRLRAVPLHSSENYEGVGERNAQLEQVINNLVNDRASDSALRLSSELGAHTKDWILPIVQNVVESLRHRRLLTVSITTKSIEGLPSKLDLSRKPTLWAVFLALVRHHQQAAGQPLSTEALFRSAWPDESNTKKAAADARVRVAVHKLRALGLSEYITHAPSGYALENTTRVRGLEPSAASAAQP